MEVCFASISDIDLWMNFVQKVSSSFPGLETDKELKQHKKTVLKFIENKQALCVKHGKNITGAILFSKKDNEICFLAVDPQFRNRGTATRLLNEALLQLDRKRGIFLITFREDDSRGTVARLLYEKMGFKQGELIEAFGHPCQKFILKAKEK